MARVTLRAIAQATGLSIQTVSAVMNDRADHFRPETVARVRQVAQALGYRPNITARAMRTGRTGIVGLLSDGNRLRTHLPPTFLDSLLVELQQRRLHLSMARFEEDDASDTSPGILERLMMDALLVNCHTGISAWLETVVSTAGVPTVWINASRTHDAVAPDDFGAGGDLTRHLLALGHRRIAFLDLGYHVFLSPERHFSKERRYHGYSEAMRDAGLVARLIAPRTREEASAPWQEWHRAWLADENRPTAVISNTGSNESWLGVALLGLGLRVPEDLSVGVFSDLPPTVFRPLSTMCTPWQAVARTVVDMLVDKLSSPQGRLDPRLISFRFDCQGSIARAPAAG